MAFERHAVHEILTAAVEEARRRFVAASAHFSETMNSVPSSLPHPDGVLRLEMAAREEKSAAQEYGKASQRFHAFLLKGVIPEDLR